MVVPKWQHGPRRLSGYRGSSSSNWQPCRRRRARRRPPRPYSPLSAPSSLEQTSPTRHRTEIASTSDYLLRSPQHPTICIFHPRFSSFNRRGPSPAATSCQCAFSPKGFFTSPPLAAPRWLLKACRKIFYRQQPCWGKKAILHVTWDSANFTT